MILADNSSVAGGLWNCQSATRKTDFITAHSALLSLKFLTLSKPGSPQITLQPLLLFPLPVLFPAHPALLAVVTEWSYSFQSVGNSLLSPPLISPSPQLNFIRSPSAHPLSTGLPFSLEVLSPNTEVNIVQPPPRFYRQFHPAYSHSPPSGPFSEPELMSRVYTLLALQNTGTYSNYLTVLLTVTEKPS